ncbi:MAG: hypothetical protein FJ184_04685, partial [Gammaproteobacteria bacterium]|nr:hypothetical protein [Gammaproteobacteria bacterium]
MRRPSLEGVTTFVEISVPVIRQQQLVELVIQNALGDVWSHSNAGEACADSAPKIVNRKRRNLQALQSRCAS